MNIIRDLKKKIFFWIWWPKDVDETLKYETEFIIKSNGSLAENKIKNKAEQILLKYKHGNNIQEHR